MSELPSGTVSLLFTDIEGSTQLLERLGRERYAVVLARHRELIRAVAAATVGVEVEMQGDSFFFAFTRARNAIGCAAEIQRRIALELTDEGLAVRIGIHTGEPDLAEDNLYVGIDVHRAARVMDAAHGGQVLLSEQTTRLVEGELPADLGVRVLGQFVLRGVTRPESLAQLEIAELHDTFPPPRAQALTSRPRRRRALYIASGLVLAVLVPVIGYFALDSGSDPLVAAANSVAVIDAARNEVVAVIGVGTTPTTIVAGGGNIWALNTGDQTISMIDETSHEFVRAISAGAVASDIAFAEGSVWVADAETNTVRVLDLTGGVEATIPLNIRHRRRAFTTPRVVLAARGREVWATGGDLTTVMIDAATRRVVSHTPGFGDVGSDGSPAGPDIAIGEAGVWATDGRDELFHLDVHPADRIQLGGLGGDEGIAGVAVGHADVWAAGAGVVWRVRAELVRPGRTYAVGAGPAGVALGAGSVWTADSFDGTVTRVDPESGQTTTIQVGGAPNDLVIAGGLVWVTID